MVAWWLPVEEWHRVGLERERERGAVRV